MTNCKHPKSTVIEAIASEGIITRRRRKCAVCGDAFTTVEIAVSLKMGTRKPADIRKALIRSLTEDDGAEILLKHQVSAVNILVEAFK